MFPELGLYPVYVSLTITASQNREPPEALVADLRRIPPFSDAATRGAGLSGHFRGGRLVGDLLHAVRGLGRGRPRGEQSQHFVPREPVGLATELAPDVGLSIRFGRCEGLVLS